ncbi:DNA-binding protein [Brevibacterium aurantiacum]|uniref:DNA-binding protein n=1 Tax=Brevibacterium aurantiacum TaxID=273384 RepID=A0A2A3X9E6_BREAU|nr:DNA-binding protein [Brevibacterium aurantiacum]
MNRKHDVEGTARADRSEAPCRREGGRLLLDEAADQLHPRPWQHDTNSPSAVDLTQYALWRSSDLSTEELLGALSLLPTARAEVESAEVGLLFAARNEGLTWAQIAEAMGFRSPQACQQYVNRLSARHGKRS